MTGPWLNKWNDRYSHPAYAYGTEPNQYLKSRLEKLSPGTILFPAEGEGRNAVFAATLGWKVFAFDISEEGKTKALRLAENHGVTIHYHVGGIDTLPYVAGQFDAMVLIYAHFPAEVKSEYHKTLDRYVRNGGHLIFEAFSKNHLSYLAKNEKVGGPKDLASLFSIEELQSDFPHYKAEELRETEVELQEGPTHDGLGSVIRFFGEKREV